LAYYTIGQRRGLEIDHRALKNSKAISYHKNQAPVLLVLSKLSEQNRLVVAEKEASFVSEFKIKQLQFINHSQKQLWQEKENFYALVKIRNQGKLIPCQIKTQDKQIVVKIKEKIFAPASGQSAVFYLENHNNLLVIAGAIIDNEALKSSNFD
jgi:tRNA U34 2-thiouridine synthase MnmA/TrmU